MDLIAWGFLFLYRQLFKEVMDLVDNLYTAVWEYIYLFNQQIGQLRGQHICFCNRVTISCRLLWRTCSSRFSFAWAVTAA